MKRLTTLIAAPATALVLFAANSFAGTLTPSGQPSFSPTNVISNNSVALQTVSSSVSKIYGNATITPGAGASVVTLTLSGTFTASLGDIASYFYDFNIALNSATPATFSLTLTANFTSPFSFTASTSSGTQAVAANSNQLYTGRGSSQAAPFSGGGNFTGVLTFNFAAGTQAGDTLVLSIPNDSIDFAVQPTAIPEPSTYALLGLGSIAVIAFARRRAALV